MVRQGRCAPLYSGLSVVLWVTGGPRARGRLSRDISTWL